MNVVIIGKNGQLASELYAAIPNQSYATALGRNEIDLNSPDDILAKLKELNPGVVINAAAYTAVDKAEHEPEAAYALNSTAVQYLTAACQKLSCRFIHISTDFVFDGSQRRAYLPGDNAAPLGIYGTSKYAGEQKIAQSGYANTVIVRTSWVYSIYGANFVKTMLRLMTDKSELSVVVDQIGSPTSASGLATFLWKLATEKEVRKVYHWSDLGVASWYDFAVEIQDLAIEYGLLNSKIPLKPILTSQYPTPAKRPQFSLLNCTESHALVAGEHWRHRLSVVMQRLAMIKDES